MVKCITGSRSSSGRFYYYLEITVQWLTCSFLHFLADVCSYTFEPFIFAVAANVSLETFQLFFWWIELIQLLVIFLVIDFCQNRWKLFISSVNAILPSIHQTLLLSSLSISIVVQCLTEQASSFCFTLGSCLFHVTVYVSFQSAVPIWCR